MAIRVIRKPPEEKPQEIECPECHAALEYLPSDVKHQSDYRESWDEITCPNCSKIIYMNSDSNWR